MKFRREHLRNMASFSQGFPGKILQCILSHMFSELEWAWQSGFSLVMLVFMRAATSSFLHPGSDFDPKRCPESSIILAGGCQPFRLGISNDVSESQICCLECMFSGVERAYLNLYSVSSRSKISTRTGCSLAIPEAPSPLHSHLMLCNLRDDSRFLKDK